MSRARQRPRLRRRDVVAVAAHLLEAAPGATKPALLRPIERRTTRAIARAFRAQGRLFLAGFERFRAWFDAPPLLREAAQTPPDWEPVFDDAALRTLRAFSEPLDQATRDALALGIAQAIATLELETSFSLDHPAAVAYATSRAAERVTRINETTRRALRTIIARAVREGWSYDQTAAEIVARYRQFAGPPLAVRPRHLQSRAHAIAVFETGDAYEAGNRLVAEDLASAGLAMQKSWLTVGDDRVRAEHRANEAAGWIALDALFPSGHDRPPTDPGCRCTLLYRRTPAEPPPTTDG